MVKCISIVASDEVVYGGPPRRRIDIKTAKIIRTVETLEGPQLEVEDASKVSAVFQYHEDVLATVKTLRWMADQLEGLAP